MDTYEAALQRLEVAEMYFQDGDHDKAAKHLRHAGELFRRPGAEHRALEAFARARAVDGEPIPEPAGPPVSRGYLYPAFPLPPEGRIHRPAPMLFVDPRRMPAIRDPIDEPPHLPWNRLPRT